MPRLALVPGDVVERTADLEIRSYFLASYRLGTPPPTGLSLMAHQPEAMRAWCRFWWGTFHGGIVDHGLKEILRVHTARASDCVY